LLGQCEFGIVYKGLANSLPTVARGPTVVTVKTLAISADQEQRAQFAAEFKIMIKSGRHVNVVNILGVVDQSEYGKQGRI